MKRQQVGFLLAILGGAVCSPAAPAADPWADAVVQYTPGAEIMNDFVTSNPFSDPSTALGEPTRFTSDAANFGGAVTPFNGAFRADEVVSIGKGGSLTVSFDEPVADDPGNPFGVDLLIFSNAFFFDADFPNGIAGTYANEQGTVEVSQNGVDFFTVPGVDAEGLFPTLGYLDLPSPFESDPGLFLSDFTKPVDPSFDPSGLTFSEMVAGYQGSGGGVGVDLADLGLSEISFVRISNASDADFVPEIDGFADVRAVPEPAGLAVLLLAAVGLTTRRYA